MSARLLSYQVAADSSFSAPVVTVTKNYGAGTTALGALNVPTTDEPNIAAAIDILSNQTSGGNIITEITTPGGIVIRWDEANQEVKVGALSPWAEAIGQSYADVVENGLEG